ncbi:hypothetical protein [uncultured Microscilla sp.]|uniref:hypothetical protein n=1 Tax=uncultured Microscilla sp. TaxID=432653 RepID=UPI0026215081|nr:hypothetical protein [uncultured Microscilla sp.]
MMSTFILTLVTAAFTFTSPTLNSNNNTRVNQNYLYQHWVMSPSESVKGVIVYRPYEVAEQKKVPNRLLYTGLTFEKGGKLLKHRWRKHGSNRGPSFDKYNWHWTQRNRVAILNIASKVGNGLDYRVEQLDKNMLKIRKIRKRR